MSKCRFMWLRLSIALFCICESFIGIRWNSRQNQWCCIESNEILQRFYNICSIHKVPLVHKTFFVFCSTIWLNTFLFYLTLPFFEQCRIREFYFFYQIHIFNMLQFSFSLSVHAIKLYVRFSISFFFFSFSLVVLICRL